MASRMIPFAPVWTPLIRDNYVAKIERALNAPRATGVVPLRVVNGRGVTDDPLILGERIDSMRREGVAMRDADLYFATEDMVSLAVAAMMEEVPDTVPPSDSGFMLLQGGVTPPVSATLRDGERCFGMTWFPRGNRIKAIFISEYVMRDMNVRIPRKPVPQIDEDVRDRTALALIDGREPMEMFMRTCWALMREPRVTETREPRPDPSGQTPARVARAARGVRVVDVREHAVDDDGHARPDGDTGKRRYTPPLYLLCPAIAGVIRLCSGALHVPRICGD